MTIPCLPYNEIERLKALGSYNLLDTLPEEDFDNITYLASVICQTPINLISLVDKDRQYLKSYLGLSASETSRYLSFCAHAINQPDTIFEVEDARLDERFHDSDLVASNPNFVFYAGIPLVTMDGFALGTLCVIDEKPRILTPEQKEALIRLAKQVMFIIEARQKKVVEDKLKLLDHSFRNTATAMALILEDGSFLDFNLATANMLGYTLEEFKGINIMDVSPIINKENWAKRWNDVAVNPNQIVYLKLKKKDAALIDVEVKTSIITLGNSTVNISSFTDITEKKKQEEVLRLSAFTIDNATWGIVYFKADGTIYNCNMAFAKIYGYTNLEEVKAKTVFDFSTDYTTETWKQYWDNLREKKRLQFVAKRTKKDGTLIDVEISPNMIQFGEIELNCVYVYDVSEKLETEKSLNVVDFSYRNSIAAKHFLRKDGTIYDFNNAAANLFGYTIEEYKNISLFDLSLRHDPESWEERFESFKTVANEPYVTILKRKDNEYRYIEHVSQIMVYQDLELCYTSMFDITEKKMVEARLELVNYVFKKSTVSTLFLNEDGSIDDYNSAYLNDYGFSEEDLKKYKIYELNGGYDPQSWKQYWVKLRESGGMIYEAKRKKKDGSFKDVEIRAQIIKYGDKEINCVYLNDLTDKKLSVKSSKIIDFSFRNAAIAMHYINKDGTTYDFNESACKLLGYSPREYKKLNILQVSTRHTIDTWVKRFDELKNGPNKPYTTALRKKDNSLVYVEIRSEIIVYEELELCFSSFIDVTEKLEAEWSLKRINQRYEYATLATSDVIWEADLLKKEIFISKNFTTFYGHPVSEGWMPYENNIWIQNINPDDMDFIIEDQYSVLSSGSNNRWVGEYRLKKADGSYAIVKDKTFALKDEEGNIIKMVGAMQDITKQRVEEERLRLMESVILNTNDAVLITEAEQISGSGPRILFANKAFTKMTGYSQEELIGKTPRIFQNEETDRKELDRLREGLEKWETCDVTLLNSKKNGEKYWVNLRVSPLANEDGKLTHWISIERDVTTEKAAALEKENLLKELVENNLELKQFSYITSHNLRAPLTNLVSICDIINPEPGTDALTLQLIDGFKTSTQNLNETLNDLLEVLIIKENVNIKKGQLTFEETLRKITESLSISLLEQKLSINADFSAAPVVNFANEYLESVFSNLLTNAVKYRHPERDPVITIKTSKESNGDTKLTFADNGIGINMTYAKDKIFGFYKRFHKNANGKGIGLYLIHSQITALGGKIEVESEVNIGTTFTINFK